MSTRPFARLSVLATACASLLLASVVQSAPPDVPEQISYQGVLLDSAGVPRTGFVDLTFRIYDSLTGGALVYVQTLSGVPLTDGVFTVVIGANGSTTDPPGPDPLSASLAEALTGDLAATGIHRFLEVTVGSETPLSRTQVLTVPYALRAETSALADVASTALAGDATSVGGLSSVFVTEIFEHTNLDGVGPGNADPSEGLGDTDGDGIANFVDADNDNDGVDDSTEVAQGSDINLVTPTVDAFTPTTADGFLVTTVTVQGTNFEPGLSVVFGSQTPAPTNLSSTSFDVSVGPQPEGTATVSVALPNGESDVLGFPFFLEQPAISTVAPNSGFDTDTTTVTIGGSGFDAAMNVAFGTQTPVPVNVTDTSFQVTVGPQTSNTVDITVTHPNGKATTAVGAFTFNADQIGHNAVTVADTQFSLAVRGAVTLVGGRSEYDFDGAVHAYPSSNSGSLLFEGQLAVDFDAASLFAGLRCLANGSSCDVVFERDLDADEIPENGVVVESGVTGIVSPSLGFDLAGRPALGYMVKPISGGSQAVVAHDRDGDGVFTGPNERVVLETTVGLATNLGKIAVDPTTGNVAYVFYNSVFRRVQVAWDRSGNGSFGDSPGGNPEFSTLVTLATDPICLGAGFAPDGDLFVVYDDGSSGLSFARDLNADGDFADLGEVTNVEPSSGLACDGAGRAGFPVSLVTQLAATATPRLLVDRNDDGDFSDVGESLDLNAISNVNHLAIAQRADGAIFVATGSDFSNFRKILVDPTP